MKPRELRLANKVALITGASKGLGKATALRFAEEGASVAVNYFQTASGAKEVCDAITGAGGRAISVQADVAQQTQVKSMVQTVLKEFGRIDILVNNAGIGRLSPIMETPVADIDLMVNINLKGTIFCVQEVAKGMRERRYGRILNLSSLAGFGTSFPGTSAYAATKAGLMVLTKRMAMELGAYNITVNAIAPGLIRTDTALQIGILSEEKVREREADGSRKAMLGKLGEPIDIANAALFLMSDEASFITAQTLTVDGGRMDFLSCSA